MRGARGPAETPRLTPGHVLLRHGVGPSRIARVTARDAPDAQPPAAPGAEPAYGLGCVPRAGGRVPAAAHEPKDGPQGDLVDAEEPEAEARHGLPGGGPGASGPEATLARATAPRAAASTWSRSRLKGTLRAEASALTIRSYPWWSCNPRAASRSRRRTRFRSTAPAMPGTESPRRASSRPLGAAWTRTVPARPTHRHVRTEAKRPWPASLPLPVSEGRSG